MDPSEQDFKNGFEAGQSDKISNRPYVESFYGHPLAYRAGYRDGHFTSRPGSNPDYKKFFDDWVWFLFRPSL